MGDYEICVKGLSTYTIREATSEEEAIIRAIDDFCNDDEFWDSEEAEDVTKYDCEIMWCREY